MREQIRKIVEAIQPFDDKESLQRQRVLAWLDSEEPIYRTSKPATPPMHLVSYFVLRDATNGKLMLIDHLNSGLKLPAGGHVEPDEDPWTTVEREAMEELQHRAELDAVVGKRPLFITTTVTIGQGEHTDVSLWYVITGDSTQTLQFDPGEMSGIEWFTPDQILATDINLIDPELHRFVLKLQSEVAKR